MRASSQRQSSEINVCIKWRPESFLCADQYLNVLVNLRALNGPRYYYQRQNNTWLWRREHVKDTREVRCLVVSLEVEVKVEVEVEVGSLGGCWVLWIGIGIGIGSGI